MKIKNLFLVLLVIALLSPFALGRPGGGPPGGGRPGGGRPGGVSRPSAPAVRPSAPAARPSVPAARPSAPAVRPSAPAVNSPTPNISRPNGGPSMNQPAGGPRQVGNPSMNQPAGGPRQAGSPSMNQPAGGPRQVGTIPSAGRPGWQNMPHENTAQIHNNMAHAWNPGGHGPGTPPPPGGHHPGGPGAPPPPPRPYWNHWGLAVAFTWNTIAITRGCFTIAWWNNMAYSCPWWNYYYYREAYPVYYWWGCPTWDSVCAFYPSYGWSTAYCYDYGETIEIRDSNVYINDEKVATQEEYAKSAAELATYDMPTDNPTEEQKKNVEWLPLGTFALSASADNPEKSTKAAIQLAATKDGLISGSFYHRDSNQTFPIQGRVDKQTQRVAFYVIGAEKTVFETGMYNLTQTEAPVMVHLNGGKESKNALLVRLTPPKEDENGNPILPDASNPEGTIENVLNESDTQNSTQSILENK